MTQASQSRYTGEIARGIGREDLDREAPLATEEHERAQRELVALMDCHEERLFRFLFVILGDREAARDCTQDTFVRAYEQMNKGKTVNTQWLYTVGRNRAMDVFRRKRREYVDLEMLEIMPDREELGPEHAVAMRQAFARLSPDDRTILYLVAVEGLSGKELASLLKVNPTAVRMRILRARERFRLAYGGTV